MFNTYGFLQVWEKLWRVGTLVLMVMTEIFVLTELLLHVSYCLVFIGWYLCMILRYASWWKEKTYHPTINGVCDWILTVYCSTFLFAFLAEVSCLCCRYGSKGHGENVPPDSWLVYDVELVKVHWLTCFIACGAVWSLSLFYFDNVVFC